MELEESFDIVLQHGRAELSDHIALPRVVSHGLQTDTLVFHLHHRICQLITLRIPKLVFLMVQNRTARTLTSFCWSHIVVFLLREVKSPESLLMFVVLDYSYIFCILATFALTVNVLEVFFTHIVPPEGC